MTDTPKHYRVTNEFDYTWVPEMSTHGIEGMGFGSRDDAIAAAEAHRAAVVADSPELAQARAEASRRLAERDEERAIIDGLRAALGLKSGVGLDLAALTAVALDKLSEDDMESADAIDGLVRESLELRALAEGELAQARERIAALEDEARARTESCKASASGNCQDWCRMLDESRERIAALEADTAGYRADLAALEVRHGRMVDAGVELGAALTEALQRGDAALARVRELEVERALLRGVVAGHAKTIAELEAAAQPKPRDESQPPPGWESYSFRDGDGVLCESMYLRRKPGNPLPGEAWRIYDEERGYAPPDEAAIRADERPCQFCDAANVLSVESLGMPRDHVFVPGQGWAPLGELDAIADARADERRRTERDIAAWVTSEAPADVDVRTHWLALGEPFGANWVAAVVERSEYPRTDAPAPAPAKSDPIDVLRDMRREHHADCLRPMWDDETLAEAMHRMAAPSVPVGDDEEPEQRCDDCGGSANGPGDAHCVNCDCGSVVCSACCEAVDGESYCLDCANEKRRLAAPAADPEDAPPEATP